MTLSFKVAMLTSLMFIGGMCWLVSQVARPTIAATRTGASGASAAVAASPLDRRTSSPTAAADGFERSAPVADSIASAPPLGFGESPAIARREDVSEPLPPVSAAARTAGLMPADEQLLARGPSGSPRGTLVAQNNTAPNIFENAQPERMPEPPAVTPPAGDPAGAPREYVVKKGDTFERIARRELKSTSADTMALLASHNPEVARRKGQLVRLGERLTLPGIAGAQAQPRDASGVARGSVAQRRLADAAPPAALPAKGRTAAQSPKKTPTAVAKSSKGSATGASATRAKAAAQAKNVAKTNAKPAKRASGSPAAKIGRPESRPPRTAATPTVARTGAAPARGESRKDAAKSVASASERKTAIKIASVKPAGKPRSDPGMVKLAPGKAR